MSAPSFTFGKAPPKQAATDAEDDAPTRLTKQTATRSTGGKAPPKQFVSTSTGFDAPPMQAASSTTSERATRPGAQHDEDEEGSMRLTKYKVLQSTGEKAPMKMWSEEELVRGPTKFSVSPPGDEADEPLTKQMATQSTGGKAPRKQFTATASTGTAAPPREEDEPPLTKQTTTRSTGGKAPPKQFTATTSTGTAAPPREEEEDEPSMRLTKQTATRSTGGKALRKQLATIPASKPPSEQDDFRLVLTKQTAAHSTGGKAPWPPQYASPAFASFSTTTRQTADDEEEEDEDNQPDPESPWSMYSRAGDREVTQIFNSSRTWDELTAAMKSAVHGEIYDTEVRERLFQRFEHKLKKEAKGGKYETYEMYSLSRVLHSPHSS